MEVGLFDAKNRLSELVSLAERGEEVVITRRGEPVAKLVSVKPTHDRAEALAAMERMAERRKNFPKITREEILAMIAEGRR